MGRKRKRTERTEVPTMVRKRKSTEVPAYRFREMLKLKGDKMIASVLKGNRIEDLQWFCSLSEPELDMLIALKMMVLRRANETHPALADKIDLKVLRDMSVTMMKNVKEELKKDHLAPSCNCEAVESWKHLDESKLSRVDVEEEFSSMTIKELWPFIRPNITSSSTWDK